MSTPSFIGILYEEGIIKFVYCHSDGYPSYLGKMLLEHYNTPELATALIAFYASVECRERGLDPLDTNLVVADLSRTDKTICLPQKFLWTNISSV